MTDQLFDNSITGTISNGRNKSIRFRAGHYSGDVFEPESEFDGLTLILEVSGWEDAETMIKAVEAIGAKCSEKKELRLPSLRTADGPVKALDAWKEFARRDDCLERMVPSDLRVILSNFKS